MGGPDVRRAVESDAEAVTACAIACWGEAFAEVAPEEHLRDPALRARWIVDWRRRIAGEWDVLVAVDDGRVVGYAGTSAAHDDPPLELNNLYVRAAYYGSGLADRLMTSALGDADAFLWAWDGNARALAYYARRGFAPDGAEKRTPGTWGPSVRLIRLVRRRHPTPAQEPGSSGPG